MTSQEQIDKDKHEAFSRELAVLLNKHEVDNEMQVPDYILAIYITNTLLSLRQTMLMMKDFYDTPFENPPTKEELN